MCASDIFLVVYFFLSGSLFAHNPIVGDVNVQAICVISPPVEDSKNVGREQQLIQGNDSFPSQSFITEEKLVPAPVVDVKIPWSQL